MADEGIKDDKDDVEGHRPILKTPEGEGLDRG